MMQGKSSALSVMVYKSPQVILQLYKYLTTTYGVLFSGMEASFTERQ